MASKSDMVGVNFGFDCLSCKVYLKIMHGPKKDSRIIVDESNLFDFTLQIDGIVESGEEIFYKSKVIKNGKYLGITYIESNNFMKLGMQRYGNT